MITQETSLELCKKYRTQLVRSGLNRGYYIGNSIVKHGVNILRERDGIGEVSPGVGNVKRIRSDYESHKKQ